MANAIKKLGKTTLVLAHNKTLAGQLYVELNNHVCYFVSYYEDSKNGIFLILYNLVFKINRKI